MVSVNVGVAKALPYRAILELADRLAPAFRRAFLDAVAGLQDDLTLSELADAFARRDSTILRTSGAWQAFRQKLGANLDAAVEQAITQAGTHAISQLPDSVQAQMRFDLTNPAALDAIDTVNAAIIGDLVNVSAQGIEDALRRAFLAGVSPGATAQRIRSYIGLTPQATNAVDRYRDGLLSRDVAVGRAQDLADAYARRLLRQRATVIARTETIRAAVAGQQAAWADATTRGLLDPDTTSQWLVTPDDRLCPLCEAVPDMNPDGVPLGTPFQTPLGAVSGPPLHPMCRCAVVLNQGAMV